MDECWMRCTLMDGWMDGWMMFLSCPLSQFPRKCAEFRQSETLRKNPTFCPCTWQILAAGF
jgi:hypothetical protein